MVEYQPSVCCGERDKNVTLLSRLVQTRNHRHDSFPTEKHDYEALRVSTS